MQALFGFLKRPSRSAERLVGETFAIGFFFYLLGTGSVDVGQGMWQVWLARAVAWTFLLGFLVGHYFERRAGKSV